MRFLNKISQFLYGRYKNDELNYALLILAIILMFLSRFLKLFRGVLGLRITAFLMYILGVVCIVLFFCRFLSKNIYKRSYENRKFLEKWNAVKKFFDLQKRKFRERKTHIYTKCPNCKAQLRLPRRKGRHTVCCPKCKCNFEKKF